MKMDLPVTPPAALEFPDFIGWYHSNILLPYPLFIITTVDEQGVPNAQPNSWGLPFGDQFAQFFVFYDWAAHHTVQNVIATREFVINIPCEAQVSQAMRSVAHYPRGVDEIAASGLTALPATVVKPPRIQECKAHFECRLVWHKQTHARGEDDAGVLVLGEIVAASGDADVLAGTAPEKVEAMKSVYVLSRSVDAQTLQTTNSMTYGTFDMLKDFLKLEKDGSVEKVE